MDSPKPDEDTCSGSVTQKLLKSLDQHHLSFIGGGQEWKFFSQYFNANRS